MSQISSLNVVFSKKPLLQFCEDCGHEVAVELASPLHIFLSYGHDANEELVRLIKTDLEKRGHDVSLLVEPDIVAAGLEVVHDAAADERLVRIVAVAEEDAQRGSRDFRRRSHRRRSRGASC
jgi:hypothetical protein